MVIIGGGFAGLYAATALRRAPVRITLIDRRNHHVFQPLLYQVATAALNPSDIAYPIRSVLRRQDNARVLLADASRVDVAARRIEIDGGVIDHDFLIVATGATHSHFGHGEWERLAPGLKTIEDALDIRRRVFLAYEAAERETDPALRREWLTFVVVGGGPTGVELAGRLPDYFDFQSFRVLEERIVNGSTISDLSEARVHLKMNGEMRTDKADSELGPVSALDKAIRKILLDQREGGLRKTPVGVP